MSGHGQCSLPDTRSSDHRGAQDGKLAPRRDTRWNQPRSARHVVPTRILLFARARMRFSCIAKTSFYVTSDTDTSKTMKSNTISRALKTEVQGKEDWEGKKLGRGSFHSSRTYRLSRSLWDPRNTHRDEREKGKLKAVLCEWAHALYKFCLSNSCASHGSKTLWNVPKLPLRPRPQCAGRIIWKWKSHSKTLHVSRPHYAEEIRKRKKNRPFWICGWGNHIIILMSSFSEVFTFTLKRKVSFSWRISLDSRF